MDLILSVQGLNGIMIIIWQTNTLQIIEKQINLIVENKIINNA
jgi:hypothetical protein